MKKKAAKLAAKSRVAKRFAPPKRSRTKPAVFGAIVAGLLAYFFDPDNGRRRRATARDRTRAFVRKMQQRGEKRARYAQGKAAGLRHELFDRGDGSIPNDETVADKIRSEVLRHYGHSRINVNVENGVAVLRGELDRPEEINALVRDVSHVPGVADVRSLLHMPNTAPERR